MASNMLKHFIKLDTRVSISHNVCREYYDIIFLLIVRNLKNTVILHVRIHSASQMSIDSITPRERQNRQEHSVCRRSAYPVLVVGHGLCSFDASSISQGSSHVSLFEFIFIKLNRFERTFVTFFSTLLIKIIYIFLFILSNDLVDSIYFFLIGSTKYRCIIFILLNLLICYKYYVKMLRVFKFYLMSYTYLIFDF